MQIRHKKLFLDPAWLALTWFIVADVVAVCRTNDGTPLRTLNCRENVAVPRSTEKHTINELVL